MKTIITMIIELLKTLGIEVLPTEPTIDGLYTFGYKGFPLFRLTALEVQWKHKHGFTITDPEIIQKLETSRNDNEQGSWFKNYQRTENVFKFSTMGDVSTQHGYSDIESIKEVVEVGFSNDQKAFIDDASRFGDEMIQSIEGGWGWDDCIDTNTFSVRQLAENILCKFDGYTKIDDLNEFVKFLQQVRNDELDSGGCKYTLLADVIEQEKRQRMLQLEKLAVTLMKDNPNDDLFEVLQEKIDHAESKIYGLSEDGLCAVNPFSSSAMDDWNDLRCGYQGNANDAADLMEYCKSQFPLQWLAHNEAQLELIR